VIATMKFSTAKSAMKKTATTVKAFPTKASLLKTTPASFSASSGKVSVSSLRGRVAGSSSPTLPPASRKSHFSESLNLRSIRKTLEKQHVEIGHCLTGLYLLEDGLLGRGPKLPGHSFLPKTQPDSMGSKVPRPKSKKPLSPYRP